MEIDDDLVSSPRTEHRRSSERSTDPQRPKRHPGKKSDEEIFEARKIGILSRLDCDGGCDNSPKGSVDALCLPLMAVLNAHPDYVTTSSCSGRIALFHSPSPSGMDAAEGCVQKRGAGALGWLFVSHDTLPPETVTALVSFLLGQAPTTSALFAAPSAPLHGVVSLKCEPFVMHIQCRSVAAAKRLLTVALGSGFRNSGVIPPGTNTMVAIRHAGLSLDAPLVIDGCSPFTGDPATTYLNALLSLANSKLAENARRLSLLTKNIISALGDGSEGTSQ
jgi:tRNA wybutosine-synthesizing protein 3